MKKLLLVAMVAIMLASCSAQTIELNGVYSQYETKEAFTESDGHTFEVLTFNYGYLTWYHDYYYWSDLNGWNIGTGTLDYWYEADGSTITLTSVSLGSVYHVPYRLNGDLELDTGTMWDIGTYWETYERE
jgi:opacity protein-like surface antigen